MADALSLDTMARHAQESVADGRALLEVHTADGLGLCRSCGREAPCADNRRGAVLVAIYRPLLRAAARP